MDVDDESAAAKAGVKEGDVITRFDGKEVNSTSALVESAQAAKSKTSVHVNLLRNGKAMEMDIKDAPATEDRGTVTDNPTIYMVGPSVDGSTLFL
ncbi:PDZ domain-containing protein [Puia sp. P3]|uniref:PDZ domain-containing protein n=1 Tax=Puia sp. P3 TaxID=3423952 RepID=UPI003D66B0D0